jgi:hypothetical protein
LVAVGIDLATNRVNQGEGDFGGAVFLLCSASLGQLGPNPRQSAGRGQTQASHALRFGPRHG